jgi:hypothetical protein
VSDSVLRRLVAGLRDTVRLLSPAVRAERAYTFARRRLVRDAVASARSGSGDWLSPQPFGAGLDERVVEVPWAFERLGAGTVLIDVGSTLNQPELLTGVLESYQEVVFVNRYRDDGSRSASPRVRYVRGDARELPLTRVPLITCLSTLEHVGCDNRRYGGAASVAGSDRRAARAAAMASFRGALQPRGRLLLTVPFGRFANLGWFEQLDAAALEHAVAAFGAASVLTTYFLHDGGWRRAGPAECAGSRYGSVTPGATAVACLELIA